MTQAGALLRTCATNASAAWTCRNKVLFKNLSPSPIHIGAGFCRMVEEYIEFTKKVCGSQSSPTVLSG